MYKIVFPYLARWNSINFTRFHQILNELAERGHEIHVLQPPPMHSEETNFIETKEEDRKNIILHTVNVNSFFWNLRLPFNKMIKKSYYGLKAKEAAQELIRNKDIDFILLYNLFHYDFIKIKTCKKIFDIADDYVAMLDYELGKMSNRLVLGRADEMMQKMIRGCEIVTAASNVLCEKIGGIKFVVPNGASLNFKVRKLNNDYKKPVIGFVGSFEYFIDFRLLLQTAKKLNEFTFLIVGSGRRFNEIKKRVDKLGLTNVVLTGSVPHDQIFSYIDEMDICLNPFKKSPISDGASPIKLFEYLALKKPVISTRVEETVRMRLPLLFADTPEEMAQQIMVLVNNKKKRDLLGARGFKFIKEKYNWKKIADQFEEILNKHSE